MAALGTLATQNLLNWMLGGATVAANTITGTAYVEVSAGSPTSVSASPIPTATIASRQQASFGSVAAGGSASNSLAMTFSAIAGCTVSGLTIQNASGTQGAAATMWAYGLLATARTLGAGDSLVFAVGSCVVTLA